MAETRRTEGSAGKGSPRATDPIGPEDRHVLRELARRVAEVAALPVQSERARLWRALNRCRPERPMILAQVAGVVPPASLRTAAPLARGFEWALRTKLYFHEHVHDDLPCTDFLDVRWSVEVGDYGVEEKRIYGEIEGWGAYRIEAPIKEVSDLARLRPRTIRVDREATDRQVEVAQDLVGDILRVRRQGETLCRNMLTRKLIHLRGFEQFLLDLHDRPDLLHRMMGFLRDEALREWELYEREGVLSRNDGPDHIRGTGGVAHTDASMNGDVAGPAHMQDMTCFGESQECVGVGPALFDEFVLQYQLPLMNRFAAVDYGCCEPQDGKFDLLFARITRLSSVSVLPWGSREVAAEKLGRRCVYAYKPHPGPLELPEPDFAAAEKDLRETLRIARGCCVSLTMKASLTPETADRATRWTDMAQRVVAQMN